MALSYPLYPLRRDYHIKYYSSVVYVYSLSGIRVKYIFYKNILSFHFLKLTNAKVTLILCFARCET